MHAAVFDKDSKVLQIFNTPYTFYKSDEGNTVPRIDLSKAYDQTLLLKYATVMPAPGERPVCSVIPAEGDTRTSYVSKHSMYGSCWELTCMPDLLVVVWRSVARVSK